MTRNNISSLIVFFCTLLFSLTAPAMAKNTHTAEQLYKLRSPAVFEVIVKSKDHKILGTGSAVAVASNQLVTNKHVIARGPFLELKQGKKTWTCTVTSVLPDQDLATLQAQGLATATLPIRPVKDLSIGETVYAIGAPQALEQTLTEGIVSARRSMNGITCIQTSAAISHGSSGGALFDAAGRLIGITTLALTSGNSLNFALPADLIAELKAHSLKDKEIVGSPEFLSKVNLQLGDSFIKMSKDNVLKKKAAYANAHQYFAYAYQMNASAEAAQKAGDCLLFLAPGDRNEKKLLAKAASYYRIALKLNPDSAESIYGLGCSSALIGNRAVATQCVDRLIGLGDTKREKSLEGLIAKASGSSGPTRTASDSSNSNMPARINPTNAAALNRFRQLIKSRQFAPMNAHPPAGVNRSADGTNLNSIISLKARRLRTSCRHYYASFYA